MDYGFQFEQLINEYIGTPEVITYSNNWNNKDERTALLYTACIKEYDKHSHGVISQKLEHYMESLFKNEDVDKQISIDCLSYLKELKSK